MNQNPAAKLLKKAITINASKEKVWEVLLQDKFTRLWYATFSEGTIAETDWQVGSKAIFKDNSNSGLVGKITENKPTELLEIEYTGVLENGEEIFDNEMALSMKGSKEIYRLVETNSHTGLTVEIDMAEEYYDMMAKAWDKALVIIKDLAEKN